MKIGRNDSCPCGSGKKYKKCHLEREGQAAQNPFESGKALLRAFEHRKCYHPNAGPSTCSSTISRAHSVRRAADLSLLAVDGHVRAIAAAPADLIKDSGRLKAKRVGINQASTFTGFCSSHDTSTFAPLETRPFTADAEQCFLLFYRAWARECFTKEGSLRTLPVLRDTDKGRSKARQESIQQFLATHQEGLRLGLRDIAAYKAELDAALTSGNFASVSAAVVWFESELPFVCSGAFYPYHSIGGTDLQTFDEAVTPDAVAITLLNEGGRGCAVMCWLANRSTAAEAFAESVLRMPNLADVFCRVVYTKLENVYSSPVWWDGLEEEQRSELVDRAMEGVVPLRGENPRAMLPRGAPFLSIPTSSIARAYSAGAPGA